MFAKLIRYITTISYLKPIQIYYRIYYLIKKIFNNITYSRSYKRVKKVNWKNNIYNHNSLSYSNNYFFNFLNIQKKYKKINWNDNSMSNLWVYNLNYFEFLNQKNIDVDIALKIIHNFYNSYNDLELGKDPYPTSLRIINMIKFISFNDIYDKKINDLLKEDSERLYHNLEYHIMGNHLLENAFALFFSSFYFDETKYFSKSKTILIHEINEQILDDGAHFELSPMYHSIILYRILDCICLLKMNNSSDNNMYPLLRRVAKKMISWINSISLDTKKIPLINDSAHKISPSLKELNYYCQNLKINHEKNILNDSGYRIIKNENFQILIDIGNVMASYQPGHSHADTFNFLLNYKGKEILVDSGISTYDNNKFRLIERSTDSHNTVSINNINSSDIWKSFRLSRRANVNIIYENNREISAEHDGYLFKNIKHNRTWSINNKSISIIDRLSNYKEKAFSNLHFHPKVKVLLNKNNLIVDSKIKFEIFGADKIKKKNIIIQKSLIKELFQIKL